MWTFSPAATRFNKCADFSEIKLSDGASDWMFKNELVTFWLRPSGCDSEAIVSFGLNRFLIL